MEYYYEWEKRDQDETRRISYWLGWQYEKHWYCCFWRVEVLGWVMEEWVENGSLDY